MRISDFQAHNRGKASTLTYEQEESDLFITCQLPAAALLQIELYCIVIIIYPNTLVRATHVKLLYQGAQKMMTVLMAPHHADDP